MLHVCWAAWGRVFKPSTAPLCRLYRTHVSVSPQTCGTCPNRPWPQFKYYRILHDLQVGVQWHDTCFKDLIPPSKEAVRRASYHPHTNHPARHAQSRSALADPQRHAAHTLSHSHTPQPRPLWGERYATLRHTRSAAVIVSWSSAECARRGGPVSWSVGASGCFQPLLGADVYLGVLVHEDGQGAALQLCLVVLADGLLSGISSVEAHCAEALHTHTATDARMSQL